MFQLSIIIGLFNGYYYHLNDSDNSDYTEIQGLFHATLTIFHEKSTRQNEENRFQQALTARDAASGVYEKFVHEI